MHPILNRALGSLIVLVFTILPTFGQNTALNFDGTNDYIQTGYSGVSGQSARTVEALIRTTANCDPNKGGKQKIIVDWGTMSTGQRFTVNLLFNNALRLEIGGSGISGQTPLNDGKWHHVAVVLNPSGSNDITLYVDGVVDTAGNLSGKWSTGNSVNLRIGRRVDGVHYFDGDIDEVRVFNTARSASDIKSDMGLEYCTYPKNLVAYYKLNDGTPGANNSSKKTAKDYAGSSYNGTLNGFALSGSGSNWIKGDSVSGGDSKTELTAFDCYSYTTSQGKVYTSPGTYSETYTNQFGCDSIVTLELTLGRSFNYKQYEECDSFVSPLGKVYHKSGFYRDTMYGANSVSCDSIFLMDVTLYGKTQTDEQVQDCDSSEIGGKWYFSDTQVEIQGTAKTGCDSIHTVNLVIKPSSSFTMYPTECDRYKSSIGNVYTKTGTYSEKLSKANQYGCDSVVVLDLTIHHSVNEDIPVQSCDSFVSPTNKVYKTTGTHTESFSTQYGCDSVIVYDVVINKPKSHSFAQHDCDSAQIDGNWYYASQEVQLTKQTLAGCDSFITIDLDVTSIDRSVVKNEKTLTANQAGAKYRWYNCENDKTVVGETSSTFTAPYSGSFAVEISLNECTSTSECFDLIGLGIEDYLANQIAVFPNPNRGSFTIQSTNELPFTAFRIMDLSGRVVLEMNNLSQTTIAVQDKLESGIYLIEIETTRGLATKRLVTE